MSTKQASKLTGADDIRPTTMMIIRREEDYDAGDDGDEGDDGDHNLNQS